MSKSKPFPAIHGGCFCGSTRYRLETAPLFNHACHCQDCNKHTGSVFACFTTIETEFITSFGKTPPKITTTVRPNGLVRHLATCGTCGTRLWASGDRSTVIADINTGTLDLPELMEPDVHEYIESKISWVLLPEGTKTCKGPFDYTKWWPKSSLKRLEAAIQRAQERKKLQVKVAQAESLDVEDEKEADKTPTAQTPDEKDEVAEDDEEFERRYLETEKALQERLEQLSLRLKVHEKVQGDDLRPGVVQAAKEPASESPSAEPKEVPAATVSEK
ncbi:hypothetical protein DPSP01_000720 [Paraphaeosphaeria sporulosa]|uniref:CENP-V/GFA domain-containing protein n=1 Tax=Paraphaeosphaeria sporulosa TaxID=1460663 RepID=A0A177CRJ6_9PLEO|nr:uncharacterized protein CC84DRAFT_1160693 [Paraphaeosphaeria sporulosa]OAG09562.1 hypothetical protein CC84DRAFT_1160693 [Paraphaeosphaeria sporulosa]